RSARTRRDRTGWTRTLCGIRRTRQYPDAAPLRQGARDIRRLRAGAENRARLPGQPRAALYLCDCPLAADRGGDAKRATDLTGAAGPPPTARAAPRPFPPPNRDAVPALRLAIAYPSRPPP